MNQEERQLESVADLLKRGLPVEKIAKHCGVTLEKAALLVKQVQERKK